MPTAPGVYTTVTTGPPSKNTNKATGTWFVTGLTGAGPTGVAVPITSLTDYVNYLGARVTYGALYDALDEYFHDGGVLAYVSRVVGPAATAASVTLKDRAGSPLNTLTFTAAGQGVWGNNISVVVANGTVANSYTISISNNGVTVFTTPNLFTPADALTVINAMSDWVSLVNVTNANSVTAAPNNNPAVGTFSLTGGTDDNSNAAEANWTTALNVFQLGNLGPGQVSAPGRTTATSYQNITNHALAYNRVALLDVADSATASTLVTQAAGVQTGGSAASDPSYGGMFAPWVIIPGISTTNPGSTSPIPNRVVPPTAFAAALMAKNDSKKDANNPAAGINGQSSYIIGTTQSYNAVDSGTLNAAGVNVIKNVYGTYELYGYRSLATDPNWVFLNNVRMRMQMIYDFDVIGESYVFSQIDGTGHVFASFGGDLSGKCQQYWTNGSLFGATAQQAFQVNTGPQVNTATTIAAGQINATVTVRLSPFGETVDINVIKYLTTQNLPS